MALFGSKNKKAQKSATVGAAPLRRGADSVIKRPRITEKAMRAAESNVYIFEVDRRASAHAVRDAIRTLYGVTPVKVNIVNRSPRLTTSRRRGGTVTVPALRKAYVYVKKGETITIV